MADTHVILITGLEGTTLEPPCPGFLLRCIGRGPNEGHAFEEAKDLYPLRMQYEQAIATCKRQHAELAAVRTRLFEVEADRAQLGYAILEARDAVARMRETADTCDCGASQNWLAQIGRAKDALG